MSMGENTVANEGPEPSGWELMRAIAEVKDTLRTLSTAYVIASTYASDQKYTADAIKTLTQALSDEASARAAAVKDVATTVDDLEKSLANNKEALDKNRKQFWLTVAGGALLLVVGIFVNPIAKALGVSP